LSYLEHGVGRSTVWLILIQIDDAQVVKHAFLGSLGARKFLQRHWQKKPLLIRGAFPAFANPLSPREVLALACTPDAQPRLVQHRAGRWSLEHGPFTGARLRRLPERNWTVLIQDTNHFSPRAARLLERFDFIPHARVDDLMVSYAAPGGGVGPHVDSYDVFLLQGHGRRRWRISRQQDSTFRPGLPLKILQRFVAEEEWVLEPGDMLYLPPGVAHEGVALDECLTWSVGFRAPSDRELVSGFLDFLAGRIEPRGHYRDPGARPARHAGEIPAPLVAHAGRVLAGIRWSRADVAEFAGRFLSEPKVDAVFDPPRRPLSRARFAALAARTGLALDARSRLLFSGTMAFMNGEALRPVRGAARTLRALSDARSLPGPVRASAAFWDLAHDWYTQGFVHARDGRHE
jgi:50S ribosomal protein L16 3-hydroxylase